VGKFKNVTGKEVLKMRGGKRDSRSCGKKGKAALVEKK